MQSYVTTSAVGGQDGHIFQDVYIRVDDGNIVIDSFKKEKLDLNHPIQKITVSHGWIVDGIAVTYQLAGGASSTLDHGSQFGNRATEVALNENECLAAVFGRAGPQSYYKRDMVNNIGFVIFDAVKETVRVVGPFGNSNHSNDGKPFYCSDVLAFGGFAENTDQLGLSGLFFYKDVAKR